MERIVLPPRYRVFPQEGSFLYFDPHNFTWAKVNESGRTILNLFRKHYTVAEAARKIAADFHLEESATHEAVRKFTDTVLAGGFLHVNRYVERPSSAFPSLEFPHVLYLHLTNKCNLKCPYCYNKTDRETKIKLEKKGLVSPTMSTGEFKEVIGSAIAHGLQGLFFTGGEPLLRPDAMELVLFARQQSDLRVARGAEPVELQMLTNAILVDDEVARQMCERLDTVTISLDGHEQHLHEEQRGKRTFEPTIRGIKRIVEMRKRLGVRTPRIALVPALTQQTIGFMKEIYEFGLDVLGADTLAPIIFQAGDHQAVSLRQIPQLTDYETALARTNAYLDERRQRRNEPAAAIRPLSRRNQCGVGNGEISVDPGGFVYPCQMLHYDEFICGNVREHDIKDIFQESPVMRQARGTTVETLPVCSHCDFRYLCHGGCRATAYNVYRQLGKHNEIYCKMLETQAVRRLWTAASAPS